MSGTTRISTGISIALILLLCSTDAISQTATYQQEIELRPGWNAVYVQVEPEDISFLVFDRLLAAGKEMYDFITEAKIDNASRLKRATNVAWPTNLSMSRPVAIP